MLKYFYDHTLPEQFFVLSECIVKEFIFKFLFIIGYICKLCMCLYLLNLYLICDICVIIFISATDEQVYVSFIDSVLFYHFCWLFLKTQVYMLYQAIATKAI